MVEKNYKATSPARDHDRLTLLERMSREAGAQLSLAMETLGDGCVLFDPDDRLVFCNQRFLEIFPILAPAMVPGTPFEDIVRYGLERGQFAGASGREEAYLAQRLAEHRSPYSYTEQELSDGRWVQVIEQATPEGGCIGLRIEITERKRLQQSLEAERDFLEQIMATSLSAVVVIDSGGRIVFQNKAAERVLGIDAATERCFDNPALGVTTVDGSPFPADQLPCTTVLTTGAPVFDVRLAINGNKGRRRLLSVNAAPLAPSSGVPRRVVCTLTDMTDQITAESDLRYKEALLRGLFELCPVGMALTDGETGAFIDVNEAALEQLGYGRDELLGMTYFDITPEEYHASDPLQPTRLDATGRFGPCEKENIRKDGSRFPILLRGMKISDLTGRELNWSIVEDITERKANEAMILHQAHYDELTGLPNRRLFQERLEQALERARRGRHLGAVAMLDLDHFKIVNDSLGHKAGDAVLIEAATRLSACTRATDTVARLGGDEFLLLLDDIEAEADAAVIARKIQDALARPFTVEGEPMQLGVSVGIYVFDHRHHGADEILRFADKAMYAAKKAGRNRTRFFARHDQEPQPDRCSR